MIIYKHCFTIIFSILLPWPKVFLVLPVPPSCSLPSMAFPNLRNIINGYSRTTITPIQEHTSFHYGQMREIDLGSDRPPPPAVQAAASSLSRPQSHRRPLPPSTKVVLKASWLHCEDCVRKTTRMINSVQGIQHLRIDTEKGVIEVEGSIDAQWLMSSLAGKFKRMVEVVTKDDQNGDIHDHNNKRKDKEESSRVGDQEDTEETDKTPAYTSIEREQVHHPIKEQDNLGSINGDQQKFSDNVKADSDLQQPPTLPAVNLQSSINKNPKPEAKNSSPQSPPTQPLNPDSYMVSPMREVVLKTQLHCEGCITKLKRRVSKIEGVVLVKINVEEELIEVQGTMDTKKLPAYLMKKLNRKVEVVLPQPQPSSVNWIKGHKGDQQMSKPKRHTSKTDDGKREHTSRENDQIGNIIKDERGTDGGEGVVFKKERKLNHSHDHATRNVIKGPKGDELADKKGRGVGDKSDTKRGGYMVKEKEAGPQVGATILEETNKDYYYMVFSDENPSACSVM